MTDTTSPSPQTAAVLQSQQAVADTNASITKLQKAIGKAETTIARQLAELPDLAALANQRADLLADIAIGENKSAELKELEAKLDKVTKQQQAAKPAVDGARQTLVGLQRKLQDAQGTLEKLQEAHRSLMRRFLQSRAEAVGAEYGAAAQALIGHYKSLQTLNDLLSANGRHQQLQSALEGLYVPNFNLEALKGMGHAVKPGSIFYSTGLLRHQTQDWPEAERAHFAALGIVIE